MKLDHPEFSAVLPGSLVLAAVSGGADSVFLARNLIDLCAARKWRPGIVHVQHHLRGGESRKDADFVRALAEKLELPFAHLHVRRTEFAPGESVEAVLREERLRVLREHALEVNARAIALGHHTTDVAETFVLMSLRGSGPRGLGSMRAVTQLEPGLHIIRPLIVLTRGEIREELHGMGQEWLEDSMNALDKYRRGRVRREVLPVLEELEPAAAALLARSASLCAEEHDSLAELALERATPAILTREDSAVLLDAALLREFGESLRRVVVRELATTLQPDKSDEKGHISLPPPREALNDLIQRIGNSQGDESRMIIGEALRAFVTNAFVLLYRSDPEPEAPLRRMLSAAGRFFSPAEPADAETALPGAGGASGPELVLPDAGGGRLRITVERETKYHIPPVDPGTRSMRAVMALAQLNGRAVLRYAEPAEKLNLGRITRTVGELLQEARVPVALRERVLVVADEDGPVWIPGIRRSMRAFVSTQVCDALVAEWETAS